ncbi:MAG TPA: PAS domain S-box protein, partial [Thermoanaerobaculia bacterium]|nr:PAS domain S-box protein [Thermoanaerobaculia bacterium]
AEQTARNLAAELRTLLETEPECVKVIDESGRLVEMNAAGLAMLEADSADQVVGAPLIDRVAPEHREAFAEQFRRALSGERGAVRFEMIGLRGGRRWLESRSALLPVGEGAPRRVVAVTRDVTEAVRGEEELRRVASAYQLLFELNPLPMWIFDVETLRFLAVNRAAVRRYGFSREEFLSRTIRDIRPPEDLGRLAENMAARRAGFEDAGRWRHVWKDGSVRTVEIFSHTIEWEGRRAELVLAHDVTESAAAERAVRESEEKYRELVEQLNDLVFEFDLRGRLSYISPVVEAITGIAQAELAGKSILDFCHPDDVGLFTERIAERTRGGPPVPIEFRLRRASGEYRWMRASASEIRRGDEIVGFRGVATDVTDLLEAEARSRVTHEQFLHAQKMEAIGRLAGGIAHDLNNLLTVILGHGELAGRAMAQGSAAEESIREVMHAADRAATLTRQLLAVARRQMLDEHIVDLNAIVEELGGMLRRILGEDLALSLSLAPGLGAVRADPLQLQQVVMNLAVNARDAMPAGGTLELATRNLTVEEPGKAAPRGLPPGRYVELAVEDSGMGMPEEVLSHIFEPFFTTKAVGKGTGLGLSTAYGIVRQSGGTIEVESRPGRGSRFSVILPRADEEAEAAGPSAGRANTVGGSESILLVEDEPSLRELARRVLEGAGYRVREAASGSEALALVAAQPAHAFDLLVTDVVMPGMRGTELARRLARSSPGLLVLLMSGYSEEDLSDVRELEGRSALLAKPFSNDVLLGKVREVLDRRRGGPARAR